MLAVAARATYRVAGIDTRVDNVGADSLASAVVIDVLAGTSLAVGDATKTPGGAVLGDIRIGAGNGILLDVFDLLKGNMLDSLHGD